MTGRTKILLLCMFTSVMHLSFSYRGGCQKLNEDSILKVISAPKDDTTLINTRYSFATTIYKNRARDTTGIRLITEALQLSQKIHYETGIARGMLLTANYFIYKGELAEAMSMLENLIRFGETITNELTRKQVLRGAYNNLGGIYNRNGDFPSSLQNRLKAVSIIESMESPSPDELFIGYYNSASDFRQLKQFGKAKEYMEKLEPLLSKITPRYQLDYYFEFYQILLDNNDIAKAREILYKYDSCLKVIDLSDNMQLDYTALSKQLHGMYELNYSKNYALAKMHFTDHLRIAREMDIASMINESQYNLGMAMFELGNYGEASSNLEEAFNRAMKEDLKNQAYKTASLLSRVKENMNELKSGYSYARIALELQDSIIQEDDAKMVSFLEAKYQHEKKEKEISSLQLKNKEKEYLINRKNWFIAGSLSLALILILLAAYITRYYKSRQKLFKQEKDLQQQKINNLEKQQQVASLQAMINGQETERTRIARDLHDGLGGIFSTVKMHYSTLQHDTPQVSGNPIYRKTMDLINNAADELRRVAHNMMPEVLLKVGLDEALKDLCNNISSGKLLRVKYQSYGMESRLSSSTEIMLYRIIQELVNNIIKHSQATEAIIQINRQGNRLNLTIEDNGRGFDTLEAEQGKSLGMNTVRSRVDYLNGSLSIDSRKDMGTTIMIDLLLNENLA